MKEIRALEPDDVELRAQQVSEKGATLLLYKDARCDMRILDEVVGPMNWQRGHYTMKDSLFCRVGIRDEKTGEWVWKSDCGTESNVEAAKGEASDSFKRACTNWGIGRELYTAPRIFMPASMISIGKGKNGRLFIKSDLRVTTMRVEDKRITRLVIAADGKTAWSWSQANPKTVEVELMKRTEEECRLLDGKRGKDWMSWYEAVLKTAGVAEPSRATSQQAEKALEVVRCWAKRLEVE